MAKSIAQEFVKGLWEEVPPFRLVLGLCPVLAVTKTVENGFRLINETRSIRKGHKLCQVCIPQLVYKVQLSVRKKAGTANTG